jgi:hypothetical protein
MIQVLGCPRQVVTFTSTSVETLEDGAAEVEHLPNETKRKIRPTLPSIWRRWHSGYTIPFSRKRARNHRMPRRASFDVFTVSHPFPEVHVRISNIAVICAGGHDAGCIKSSAQCISLIHQRRAVRMRRLIHLVCRCGALHPAWTKCVSLLLVMVLLLVSPCAGRVGDAVLRVRRPRPLSFARSIREVIVSRGRWYRRCCCGGRRPRRLEYVRLPVVCQRRARAWGHFECSGVVV